MTFRPDAAVIGLGYVGITLSAALADAGVRVLGVERRREVAGLVDAGRCHIYEPGLDEILARVAGKSLRAVSEWPSELPGIVVICVSTPVDPVTRRPDLSNLAEAAHRIAQGLPRNGLVLVRSTVPVGTSRNVVLDIVRRTRPDAGMAFCPERTVQGAALMELRNLPQVIGAVDADSAERAAALFRRLTPRTIVLAGPEEAEMVKLVNNCHTDLLYAFGNEVALMCASHGIDPLEVIRGANEGYTEQDGGFAVRRPRIAVPGFVGGGCLSKDPYLLLESLGSREAGLSLVHSARSLNEAIPGRSAEEVLGMLASAGLDPRASSLLVCGFAYKGRPETDDLRGAPVYPFLAAIGGRAGRILGHDYRVPAADIERAGAEPVDLESAVPSADALILLNDHPSYRSDLPRLIPGTSGKPLVIYDAWRILRGTGLDSLAGIRYGGIGYAR